MWTEQKIELTKQMWGEGFSASQISQRVKKSRAAVIGKLHRMGLQKHTRSEATAYSQQRERARAARCRVRTASKDSPKRLPEPPSLLPMLKHIKPIKPGGIAFDDLTATTCRWPITDSLPHRFCGRNCEAPYCPEHREIASPRRNG